MNKKYLYGSLLAIILLLGFFDFKLIFSFRNSLKVREELKIEISHQNFEIHRLNLLSKVNGLTLSPRTRNVSIDSESEDILNLNLTYSFLLWLPDSGCELCWETMMNNDIASKIQEMPDLLVISNNANRNDVLFLLRKFGIRGNFLQIVINEDNFHQLKGIPPMLFALTNDRKIEDGIQIDLNEVEILTKWIEALHLNASVSYKY